jgi:hypothetical protein
MTSVGRRMDDVGRGGDLFGQYYTQQQNHLLGVGLCSNNIVCCHQHAIQWTQEQGNIRDLQIGGTGQVLT